MKSLYRKMAWLGSVFFVFFCPYLSEVAGQSAANSGEAKRTAEGWISSNEEMLISLSDELWRNAELPFEEYQTMKIMVDALEKEGFQIEKGVAEMPTAFVATYGSGKPVIALLAEMDAMPGMSQEAVPYRKPRPGSSTGHGCQHNLVAASSIGSALALKKVIDDLNISGTVKVFGPPAEEVFFGKVYLAKAGLFDDSDVCLTWHSDRRTNARYNGTRAVNTVQVKFRKKGRLNPLRSLLNLGRNIEFLAEVLPEGHLISDPAIIKGGGRPGLSPEVVEAWYSLRAWDRSSVDSIFERFKQVAAFESALSGSEVEVTLVNGVYPRLPIAALVEVVDRNLQHYGPPQFTDEEREFARGLQEEYRKEHPAFTAPAALHETLEPPVKAPKPAANDNGDVSWVVPMSSISGSSRGMDLPSHNWQSTAAAGMGIGHKVMILMTKTLTGAAVDLMTNPADLKAVRDEFEEKTRGFVYKPYLPEQPPLEFYQERNKTFSP